MTVNAAILAGALLVLAVVGAVLFVWWLAVGVCLLPLIALVTFVADHLRARVEQRSSQVPVSRRRLG